MADQEHVVGGGGGSIRDKDVLGANAGAQRLQVHRDARGGGVKGCHGARIGGGGGGGLRVKCDVLTHRAHRTYDDPSVLRLEVQGGVVQGEGRRRGGGGGERSGMEAAGVGGAGGVCEEENTHPNVMREVGRKQVGGVVGVGGSKSIGGKAGGGGGGKVGGRRYLAEIGGGGGGEESLDGKGAGVGGGKNMQGLLARAHALLARGQRI